MSLVEKELLQVTIKGSEEMKISLQRFISRIEDMLEECKAENTVCDTSGKYSKFDALSAILTDAKELIKFGEYQIALENMLENLFELSIHLDKDTLLLARLAFGEEILPKNEKLLEELMQ